ncbi:MULTISPECIES: EAL domain-containing protein [unclassified Thioalkalivibrio]|uniref:EAL domain-containing protein n=1 Tax=unclassified Thioalkalivibrio TaxID=2621013 RepID=UPI0003793409|nr:MULTISPECIES: EAL domain-containing protein [unclassified Thioalkalivibrio]
MEKPENQKKMDSLTAHYKKNLLGYKTQLQEAWAETQNIPESLHLIRNIAHRLSGSGAAFGFAELSQRASELEWACEQAIKSAPPEYNATIFERLQDLLSCIERSTGMDEDVDETDEPASINSLAPSAESINLLLVDDDPDFSAQVSQVLNERGYQVHCLEDITGLEQAIARHQPLALIVDMDFYGDQFAGSAHVFSWRRTDGTPLPVFFVSAFDSFELRLAAARAGGNHFLSKPLDIPNLISLLHSELDLAPSEPYRIMLVDDDDDLLNLYGSLLSQAGYNVSTATSAKQALSMLEYKQPELIIIDVYMPDCSGLDLGKIIRQHEDHATIPLLFMSAAADTDVQLACARLANDEFVSKPIEPWRLLMVVKSRVSRGRLLRAQGGALTASEAATHHDPLTSLPTLSRFRIAAEKALQHTTQDRFSAVMKLDVRDFHTINNVHGNFFGDRVLQQLAWELSRCLNSTDVLSRENGDEFLVLSHGHDSRDSVSRFAKQMIQTLETIKVDADRSIIAVSVDMGIAIASTNIKSAAQLLDHADTALFRAKKSAGASVCFFDESMLDDEKRRFNRAQCIRQALSDGQFTPAYQPILSIDDTTVVGFEALARWQHPDEGVLGPGAFISLMEEQDLIKELTHQMLAQALAQLACWQSRQPGLYMSVNLSAIDIQQPTFLAHLEALLAEHKLPPESVVIEITESLLLSDWEQASVVIKALRNLGVCLALDDFGTGYSSLSYLHRIQAGKLKIDRSFLQHWSHTGDSRLLQAMVQLGHTMNMTVIAEGIEEREELDLLHQLQCDQYQGFITAKPLVAKEIEGQHWV